MFKQIINLNGDEQYLIFSLIMFLVFFVLVGIMLIRMNKDFAKHMSEMPLEGGEETSKPNTDNL